MSYQDYLIQVVLLVARLATILMYSHHKENSNEDRINRSNGRSKDIIVFIDVNNRNIPYRTNRKMAYHGYRIDANNFHNNKYTPHVIHKARRGILTSLMGRWDNQFDGFGGGGITPRRNYIRIAKFVILVGFIIVAVVVLSVFIPRAGLTLNDVIVQFGEQGKIQRIDKMGPFSSVMITPESEELNFDKVIVKANNGKIETIKFR
ncbi:MAG: uncharacterized protein K0S67_2210 [Nitrososphaeraceae archaeon]|nr:uncharacterized protein [Nitrososphaeraceae archaeon]